MNIFVIHPHEFGEAERARWRTLQDSHPALGSPCFCPEFTLAAAHARPDVRIAVLESQGRVVGFLPHQQRWGAGRPAGGSLSDHHGVIAAPGTRWDWAELLQGARLAYWQFDHLAAWQRPPAQVVRGNSPGLDLSGGFAAWWQRKRDAGSGSLASLPRKLRKLEREVGPVRFELDCRDDSVFQTVLALKSEQCRRTGAADFLSWGWTRAMLEHIRATDLPHFGGRVSALYAGDTLVAAHFGMRSSTVWHWWFPVYSHAHAAYSPGALLLLRVAEGAAAQGHTLLDLGKGPEQYKASFADCGAPLLEGVVSRPAVATLARQVRKQVGAWVRTSPAAQPLRPLLQVVRGRRGGAPAPSPAPHG